MFPPFDLTLCRSSRAAVIVPFCIVHAWRKRRASSFLLRHLRFRHMFVILWGPCMADRKAKCVHGLGRLGWSPKLYNKFDRCRWHSKFSAALKLD